LEVRAGGFRLRIEELTLQTGEYLAILGPTGSGKTVLLQTLAGLRRPASGSIWFDREEVTRHAPEQRRAGFVYQDYALFPHLNVARNIAFGIPPRLSRARAEELATLLGIEHLLGRYPAGLSGGEQQRVAIARALAIEPAVLLLDEPLSALDRETRRELRGELARLHDRLHTTVLHVTHDLDEALALGHRLAILVAGELRQIGTPSHVLHHPVDATVARLTGATNVFPAVLTRGDDELLRLTLRDGPEIRGLRPPGTQGTLPLEASGQVTAVIRPEEIDIVLSSETSEVSSGTSPLDNVLTGTVRQISLHSAHASIEVDAPPTFTVHVLRPEVARRGLAVDSRVILRFPAAAISVCSDTDGSRH